MGQQQLLLLILSAVIVGVAVLVGVNMFQENAAQANQDAVVQECMTIMSKAQAWYRKPTIMGGGGYDLSDAARFNFAMIGADSVSENVSAPYTLTGTGVTTMSILGTGTESLDDVAGVLTVTVTADFGLTNPALTTAITK